MKNGDKVMLAIFACFLIAGICIWAGKRFIPDPAVLSVEILQDGRLIRKVRLEEGKLPEEFIIRSNGGYNTIRVEGIKIAVIEADCPDGDCVHRGWLKRAGDTAVCLPHRLVIRVIGDAAVDGVTY